MRSGLKKISALVTVVICVACAPRTEAVYNVAEDPAPTSAPHTLSEKQVGDIIAETATEKHWVVSNRKSGLMHCRLEWDKHVAEIDVTYTKHNYNITLSRTQNLMESDGMIHKRYNQYIHELQDAIDHNIAAGGHS